MEEVFTIKKPTITIKSPPQENFLSYDEILPEDEASFQSKIIPVVQLTNKTFCETKVGVLSEKQPDKQLKNKTSAGVHCVESASLQH